MDLDVQRARDLVARVEPVLGFRGVVGEGEGGVAGFAKGGATVRLAEVEGGGTRLGYEVEAQVGGKIAQLGARLVDGTAKKLAAEFFDNFAKALGGG